MYLIHNSFLRRRNGRADLWTPNKILGKIKFWIDLSDENSLTFDGNKVVVIADKSGTGNNAIQTSSAMQAIYNFDEKVLDFNGNNLYEIKNEFNTGLENSIIIDGNSETIQLVNYENVEGAAQYTYYSGDMAAGERNAWVPSGLFSNGATIFRVGVPQFVYESETPFLGQRIFGLNMDGSLASAIIDGSIMGTEARNILGGFSPNPTIGALNPETPRHYGTVSEIISGFYLGSTDRQKVEGYLSWKWDKINGNGDLVQKLPNNHPYKTKPPTK